MQKKQRQKVRSIAISEIIIMKGHRPIDRDKVQLIADSIEKIGLRTPVSVLKRNKGIMLVAGAHRVEAMKLLGHDKIDCVHFKGSNAEARKWRLVENFHRADLTAYQRAEFAEEWRKMLQPKQADKEQQQDKGISRAAKTTGLTRETIRRAKKIMEMSPEAKSEVKLLGLDNNQHALLSVSSEATPELQVEKARELAQLKKPRTIRKRNPKQELHSAGLRSDSSKAEKEFVALKKVWKQAKAFKRAWKRSHKKIRQRFFVDIMME